MKKIMAITLAVVFSSLICSVAAMAQDTHGHGSHHKETAGEAPHHGEQGHSDHGSMHGNAEATSDGTMVMVGSQVIKGVRAMLHLNDSSAAMATLGMASTHHLMVKFVDEKSGQPIDDGVVAVKITNPDAKVGNAIEMHGMDGHFGADVVLDVAGEYHFRMGTKLADGEPRKFHFHHTIRHAETTPEKQ